MFDLLPQIIIIFSIAGIIVVIARKIPKLSNLPEDVKISDVSGVSRKKIKTPSFINKAWAKIKSARHSKYFHQLLDLSEKILRKLKVVFLKLENKFSDWAEFLKEHSRKTKIRRSGIGIQINSGELENKENKPNEASAAGLYVVDNMESMDKAEERCIAAITKNHRDIKAYKELGYLYLKKNNPIDAREAFQQVLRLDHFDKEAEEQLRKMRMRKIRKI